MTYFLFALKHLHNNELKFSGLRTTAENLLRPAQGDGLTIAYHGLNLGRVALCATAAGSMRVMLANLQVADQGTRQDVFRARSGLGADAGYESLGWSSAKSNYALCDRASLLRSEAQAHR